MAEGKTTSVLVVSQLFYPDTRGGSEKVMARECRGLAERGLDVTALVRKDRADLPGRETVDGVKVVRYESPRSGLGRSLADLRHLPGRIRQLAAERPFDAAVVHHPFAAYGLLRAGLRLPTLYVFHASFWREVLLEGVGWQAGPPWMRKAASLAFAGATRFAEGASLRAADRIIVLSCFSRELLRKTYRIPEDRISVNPGGVDTEAFTPASDPRVVRRVLALPEDRILLLCIRRLVGRMGVGNLVAAAKDVTAKFPQVVFLIGGTGPLKSELEKAAADLGLGDGIRFLGFIKDEELPLYYQAADAFVLPTAAYEGFGLVTLEAMACGTPVLGTPVGATPELLDRITPDQVFRGAAPADIADGILRYLQGLRSGRRIPPVRLARFVAENYSWDRHIASLHEEITRLASSRTSS